MEIMNLAVKETGIAIFMCACVPLFVWCTADHTRDRKL